jgi:phage-related protein
MPDTLELPTNVAISVGSGVEETARILKAQFGNSYAQRSGDGLNNISSVYSVSFENLTRAEANFIVDFFRDQGGYKGFYWTPPGQTQKLWRCEKWSRTHVDATFDSLAAQFEEVFTP